MGSLFSNPVYIPGNIIKKIHIEGFDGYRRSNLTGSSEILKTKSSKLALKHSSFVS